MSRPVPITLRLWWAAQYPLWWLAPNSRAFFTVRAEYAKRVRAWLYPGDPNTRS